MNVSLPHISYLNFMIRVLVLSESAINSDVDLTMQFEFQCSLDYAIWILVFIWLCKLNFNVHLTMQLEFWCSFDYAIRILVFIWLCSYSGVHLNMQLSWCSFDYATRIQVFIWLCSLNSDVHLTMQFTLKWYNKRPSMSWTNHPLIWYTLDYAIYFVTNFDYTVV